MLLQRRKTSLALFSLLSLTLSACPAQTTQPSPPSASSQPSATPNPSMPASPGPNGSVPVPTPSSGTNNNGTPTTPTPTPNPGASSSTTVNLPDGTRLVVSVPNRFLDKKSQSVQLNVRLLDQSGREIPIDLARLSFVSSRPEDFSVNAQGLITALKEEGFTTITVQVNGTEIKATQTLSVSSVVFGGSGGGGGGGGSGSSSNTPASTRLNVNTSFEGLRARRGEFQVNTYTLSNQRESAVAMDADGDFVVVWESAGQDGSSYGVYAQRYHASGVARGAAFKVNTYTSNNQSNPAVAMDAAGDFVVTWQSEGQDGNGREIYAQRYNTAGAAQGNEFRVNTETTGSQSNPAIAMDADGDFVVTWEGPYQDGDGNGIYAQRYNASGSPQGSEFRVNTYTSNNQNNPAVAMDTDGDFVVIWQSYHDESGRGVYAQRYNASGSPQGSEFRVNTYTSNNQERPAVAMDSDGDFVVTWSSYGQDNSRTGIYAKRYNASGVVQGSEFRVNTYTSSYQSSPAVAMDAAGDFVITWQSEQDGDDYGIYAQRYSATGAVQGSEFQVNTYTSFYQSNSAVAMDADGDFVVTWQSRYQDGDEYGVYAQQYSRNQ
jgi:hypothetical protein